MVLESRTAYSTQISTPPTRSMMALKPSKSKTAKWSISTPVKSSTATLSNSGPVAAAPHPFSVALIRVYPPVQGLGRYRSRGIDTITGSAPSAGSSTRTMTSARLEVPNCGR